MPLDPEIDSLLQQINAMPEPDYSGTPAAAIVAGMRATPPRPPLDPDPRLCIEDQAIPSRDEGRSIPVRVYRPVDGDPLGVVVNFHGGGWVLGSLDMDEHKCRELSIRSGCSIVSVDYRLAPEHPFPAALEDCLDAVRWTADNPELRGSAMAPVAVSGASAGANLAAAVALHIRDQGGPALAFQLLIYPVCDPDFDRPSYLENGKGLVVSRAQMQWFWDQYVSPEHLHSPYVAPLRAEHFRDLPAALIITAEYDPLRDEGEAYADALRQGGVDVGLIRSLGVPHGYLTLAPQLRQSIGTLESSAAALRSAFRSAAG